MNVSKISAINICTIREVLASSKLTHAQKVQFMRNNNTEIKQVISQNISGEDYKMLMSERHLEKFKPIKNSFTKRGDKILLAKTLGIPVRQVNGYVKQVCEDIQSVNNADLPLPPDKIDAIKTYVYRHGSKDQLVGFLGYELMKTKDVLGTLYTTLEYHNEGVADYFIRPIHRMDNKTLINIYNVIDKRLFEDKQLGKINEIDYLETSEWALKKIYLIQNNSKLINAVKTYKELAY